MGSRLVGALRRPRGQDFQAERRASEWPRGHARHHRLPDPRAPWRRCAIPDRRAWRRRAAYHLLRHAVIVCYASSCARLCIDTAFVFIIYIFPKKKKKKKKKK